MLHNQQGIEIVLYRLSRYTTRHNIIYSCKPDHVMLRSETPANLCLCIYPKNIRLLVTLLNCFPNIKDFISSNVCDTKKKDCMQQNCSSFENLKFWHEIHGNKLEDDDESIINYQ